MSDPKPPQRDVRASASRRRSFRPVRAACRMGTMLIGAWLASAAAGGQSADPEILSVLADMIGQKYQFKPDRLHEMGVEGLSAVLDELLPDTAEPKQVDVSGEILAGLIERLGHENLRVRESASEKLRRLGPGIRPALVEATRSADAEVSWRATRILRGWESKNQEDKARYYSAFSVYAAGIRDDARLEELVRRTLIAFRAGMPGGGRRNILRQCVRTVAASGKQSYSDRLRPLLKHDDVRVAVLATQAIGSAVRGDCCPPLFVDALKADRREIVAAAIVYTQNCAGNPQESEIKRILIDIFEGDDEEQKLRATRPLLYTFQYAEVRDFLLEQANSGDRSRQYQALSYLGGSPHRGQPADEKVLEALTPLLKSADNNARRMAVRALGSYAGEEVVKHLIPLLADKYSSVPREVRSKLLEQPDKKMVRRLLAAAARDDSDEKVRQAAAELVKKLDQQE